GQARSRAGAGGVAAENPMRTTTAVVCLIALANARAQNVTPAGGFEPIKIGTIILSGSIRARVYGWDWFQPDSGDNAYAYTGNILRIGLSQTHQRWEWNAEFAVPFLLGLPSNPVAPGTQGPLGLGANYLTSNNRRQNTAMIFPKQLYVRFTKTGLKIGRFDFSDGGEVTPRNATLAALKR